MSSRLQREKMLFGFHIIWTPRLHIDDVKLVYGPVFKGAVGQVPGIKGQNVTAFIRQPFYHLSYLRMMIGIFLCLSSFMAICSGSVSPSNSTMTGAHMAIWSARVPERERWWHVVKVSSWGSGKWHVVMKLFRNTWVVKANKSVGTKYSEPFVCKSLKPIK